MKPLIAAMRMFFIVVRPATAQDNERADTTFKLGSHGLLELDPGDPPVRNIWLIRGGRACW